MKTLRMNLTCCVALSAMVMTAFAPVTASAQTAAERNRQEKKNEWRNLAYLGGALGAVGLITKNDTLMWAGIAGGLYSAHRYEQDRKSQSKMQRQRAAFYGKSTVWHNGKKYKRKTIWKNGQKYYTFVRAK
jgi:hypothetical protein